MEQKGDDISGNILPFHVLVHCFSYLLPYDAYFLSQVCRWYWRILREDVALRAQLHRNFRLRLFLTNSSGPAHALDKGNFPHVELFLRARKLTPFTAIHWALVRNNMPLLELAIAYEPTRPLTSSEVLWMCKQSIYWGHLHILQYMYREQLVPHTKTAYDTIMRAATQVGMLHIMQWAYEDWDAENGGGTIDEEAWRGVSLLTVEVVQWLYEQGALGHNELHHIKSPKHHYSNAVKEWANRTLDSIRVQKRRQNRYRQHR
jgi:hypothetical protein